MLSGFRFVIGAILATAMLGVSSLGVYTTVKLKHQAKAGPIESSRTLVFDDRADWNQFYDPDSARRFEELVVVTNATEASAPTSIEPRSGEPPAAQAVTKDASPAAQPNEARTTTATAVAIESTAPNPTVASTPVWDEEPLMIAEDEPPLVMEHTGSTPATAGSAIADHPSPSPPPPSLAAPDANPATIAPARKAAPKAKPVAREPDSEPAERAQKSRAARRRQYHAPQYAAQPYALQYQYAPRQLDRRSAPRAQYWQPFAYR
jgi:hypothetical protein